MTAIEKYSQAKAEFLAAQAWAALLTAPSNGKIVDTNFSCSIKAQAANPVRMPQQMAPYVEAEAKKKADNIIAGALNEMGLKLVALAEEARREYLQIAQDAGLTFP